MWLVQNDMNYQFGAWFIQRLFSTSYIRVIHYKSMYQDPFVVGVWEQSKTGLNGETVMV